MSYYLRKRPGLVLALSVGIPLAFALLNVLVIYSPLFPGYPPRDSVRLLVFAPPVLAVVLLQAMPFGSLGRRLFLSATFGLLMFAGLFLVHLLGACSYGDCF
jgi:hypothetical protein